MIVRGSFASKALKLKFDSPQDDNLLLIPLPPHANQFLITSPERKVHDAGGRTDDQKGDQERRRRVHVQGVPGFDHRKQFRGENDPAQYQT